MSDLRASDYESVELDALVAGLLVTATVVIMSVLALTWGWVASAALAAVLVASATRMGGDALSLPLRVVIGAGAVLNLLISGSTLLG